jgi:hypothetical protein
MREYVIKLTKIAMNKVQRWFVFFGEVFLYSRSSRYEIILITIETDKYISFSELLYDSTCVSSESECPIDDDIMSFFKKMERLNELSV